MKALKDIRILVIDDEQIFLDGVRLGFAISGFKGVRVESDPRKVVTILESEEEFDIAFFLCKPVTKEDLVLAINRVVK